MNLSLPLGTVASWREEAELFRRRGQEELARIVESLAEEMEAALRGFEFEALTLEQAVEETGRSYSYFQHRIADGTIHNAGKKGAPRIHRRDAYRIPMGRENGGRDLADKVLLNRLK